MAKVAVLMPAFNASRFIGAALASLLRQRDAARLEIVVVDDGSTDDTAAIVRGIGAAEIRLIGTENFGIAAARNTALAAIAADTDFVTFLDADDLSPAGRLARDLTYFTADPELELVYGSQRAFRSADRDSLAPADGEPTLDVRSIYLGAGLYRSALLRAVGGFDTSFRQGEDTDFLFRIFEQRPKFLITDDICVYYRRHGGNATKDYPTVRRGLSMALLKSMRRRKGMGEFALPPGLFQADDSMAEWW